MRQCSVLLFPALLCHISRADASSISQRRQPPLLLWTFLHNLYGELACVAMWSEVGAGGGGAMRWGASPYSQQDYGRFTVPEIGPSSQFSVGAECFPHLLFGTVTR